MSGDNVEVVRRLFRAVEERDPEPMYAIYDPGVEIHEACSLPYGGTFHGHAGAVEHALGYLAAWEHLQTADDRRLEPRFTGAGDLVLVRWRQKAGGGALDVPVISEYRLRAGRVVESRMHTFDSAALARFLERTKGPG